MRMSHPAIDNRTPFAFEPVFLTDEEGRPVLVPVVKATYHIEAKGRLALSEQQVPVTLTGECRGSPAEAGYKYEPETALPKVATDIVLVGTAWAPRGVARELDVTFSVGQLEHTVRVIGDRRWVVRFTGGITMSDPEPFDRMPLFWERAFGGWDRSDPDPSRHALEPRNPVGTGFRRPRGKFQDGIRLPNLEDPRHRLKSWGDAPPPVGFGFVSPDWTPRAQFAGTYDADWMTRRLPALPPDFDRRFFNAAAPGLVASGHLEGGETVHITNIGPAGNLGFRLPRVPPPTCTITSKGRVDETVGTALDTVVVNTDESLVLLLWRGMNPMPVEPHQLQSIAVQTEGVPVLTE